MVSGWKTENRLTLWPQLLTSETYSCRCMLFGLVCQVKIAVLPTVARVSNFRRGRRDSKPFALCRCTEILLFFPDVFFFRAFITTLKINKEEKASTPNVLSVTRRKNVFLSRTGAPVLLAWHESKQREVWKPHFPPPELYYWLKWDGRPCTKAPRQEVGKLLHKE